MSEIDLAYANRGVSILKWEKNRLGEVEGSILVRRRMTFHYEQVTNGVTSFGVLLSQRRSQRRPKQKRDPLTTECVQESQK